MVYRHIFRKIFKLKIMHLNQPRQIVRLEDPNGVGIFRSSMLYRIIWMSGDSDISRELRANEIAYGSRHNNFNPPQDDPGIEKNFKSGKHYCAYKSIDQLYEWIQPKEIKLLIEHAAIKVMLITVSECYEGNHQIAFEKKHILEQKCISELF